jgi:Rieske Fe-S protein
MSPGAPPRSRREFLAAGVAALAITACKSEPPLPPGLLVELASLPEGERVRLMVGEEPVEVVRSGNDVRARSLFCTHTGCGVRWDPQRNIYQCLCHDGHFDPTGKVLSGPPTQPLRTVRTLRGGSDKVLLVEEPLVTADSA